jgi:hypothetical protein
MKTKSIVVLLFSVLLTLACKSDKKEENKAEAPVDNSPKGFRVTLNVTVKKDDTFSLFYAEDDTADFKKAPMWQEVKGSEMPQNVVYNLPEEVVPSQLRLDFGMNKDQAPIKIHSVKMEYYTKSFEIPGNQFYIYFNPDLSKTIFDKVAVTVSPIIKDGKSMMPSFYPHTAPLGEAINKLVK